LEHYLGRRLEIPAYEKNAGIKKRIEKEIKIY
jgi:hypothetical protein